jgi:glycosyltransferase involved in cell wall biosynthesis
MPSDKADGLEAMKLCEALAEKTELELIMPKRINKVKEDLFVFYNIQKKFKVIKLTVIDTIPLNLGKFGFLVEAASFSITSFFYLLFNSNRKDIIFSHDILSIFLISFIRKNVFYDIHDFPKRNFFLYRILFKNVKGIITTNQWKKERLTEIFKISASKIIYYPNGVEIEKFNLNFSKTQCRLKLKLPENKILIGYVGMLKTMDMEKGIDTAIEALKFLEEDALLTLVGGRANDIEYYRNYSERMKLGTRVIFTGWTKHELIPEYLQAFDVLIAPFPKSDHYNYFMSPMKIFEYMASGRPIVASDLNSIREILTDETCVFVESDNPAGLAEGINKILKDKDSADLMSAKALIDVKKYTWENRANAILNFITNNLR